MLASSPRLGNDLGHLVNLSLCASERSEPLLCELNEMSVLRLQREYQKVLIYLTSPLILAVPEQFDNTAFVWSET
jgi:hypothetical protein